MSNECNGLTYKPEVWRSYDVCTSTNCYIYAINLPKNPHSTTGKYWSWEHVQPGKLGGVKNISQTFISPFDKEKFINAVKLDLAAIDMEIVESTYEEVRKGRWWKVALVFDNSPMGFGDYHWYRQNEDGTWSHKMGSGDVKNVDSSDQPITNPETCNRGRYTTFVGFYMIRKKNKRKNDKVA